jgi:general secretion pathway protein L
MMESLRIFWAWWRDQLLELFPGHAERRRRRARDGVILSDVAIGGNADPAHASVLVNERRNGAELAGERITLDAGTTESLRADAARNRLPIVLRLPGQFLLERDVVLPIAAERELSRVLFFEMDRFTPFAASEVLWSYGLRGRDRAQGKLTARLSIVQRAAAAPLLAVLAQAGLAVSCLELPAADGEPRRIFLDRADGPRGGSDRMLRPALALAAVLLGFAVVSPFLLQGMERDEVEQRIARYAPAVLEVQHLRAAAAAGTTGSEVIADERRRAGDALEAIALLTEALPDDTYLTSLTYDTGKLTLDGQSKSAAALIAPLTANQHLQDASFTAPVVRNTLGLDSFSMRLRVID